MIRKSFHILILILCLGLIMTGCPKKTVVEKRNPLSRSQKRPVGWKLNEQQGRRERPKRSKRKRSSQN